MKFLFIVQGEGRGHLTQAISLYNILVKNEHEVCSVIVGKSKRRELPRFFSDQIQSSIHQFESPNFVTDKKGKSVKIFRSIFLNLLKLTTFIRSINRLDTLVKSQQPDVIINFYDFLGGLYYLMKKPKPKHVVLAHQFFVSHPSFDFPRGRFFDRTSMMIGNKLAGYGASKTLTLSFQELPDTTKLTIVPPLLRKEIREQPISQENHFLVYMVNHGYAEQVEKFHLENPDIPIHCFWDKKGVPETYKVDDNLTFHQLNDRKFIALMASCQGYLTTAGFESVCEAMYMGKPILMVPVKGHYEQSCNALDATNAGAGISSEIFELEKLLSYIPKYKNVQAPFKNWCNKTEKLFIQNLTDVN